LMDEYRIVIRTDLVDQFIGCYRQCLSEIRFVSPVIMIHTVYKRHVGFSDGIAVALQPANVVFCGTATLIRNHFQGPGECLFPCVDGIPFSSATSPRDRGSSRMRACPELRLPQRCIDERRLTRTATAEYADIHRSCTDAVELVLEHTAEFL